MRLAITVIAAATSFSSNLSYAQLGAPAPLPQVTKVEGPTMEQTVAWLMNKVKAMPAAVRNKNDAGEPAVIVHSEVSRVFIVGCNVWKASQQDGGQIYSSTGPIEELDAEHFKIRPYGYNDTTLLASLSIPTFGERRVFKAPAFAFSANIDDPSLPSQIDQNLKGKSQAGVFYPYDPYLQAGIGFTVPDMETAQGIGKAFKHLALLCRKKSADLKAADEAAKAAKPKDLF